MGTVPLRVTVRCSMLLTLAFVTMAGLLRYAGNRAMSLSGLDTGLDRLARVPFADALTGLCSVVLAGCAVWLVVVMLLVVLEALTEVAAARSTRRRRGRSTRLSRLSTRLCPARLRRLVLAGCGAALVSGLAGSPAIAGPEGVADPDGARPSTILSGLVVPDRTVGTRQPVATTIRVRPGDSLWSIAERVLPHDAGDREVDSAWHAIRRTNRARIGHDPDLIFPGTRLRIPDLDQQPRREPS